jgi:hypothetical protein
MRRREFIGALGAAAAWSLAARAQKPALPVIGYLGPGSAESDAFRVTAFRQGLNESGYVEGQNVTIDFRWAEDNHDRLPAMAADLVGHQVTVIVATSTPAVLAAKAATSTRPACRKLLRKRGCDGVMAPASLTNQSWTGARSRFAPCYYKFLSRHFRSGSISTDRQCPSNFRLSSSFGSIAASRQTSKGAISGLMRCNIGSAKTCKNTATNIRSSRKI